MKNQEKGYYWRRADFLPGCWTLARTDN